MSDSHTSMACDSKLAKSLGKCTHDLQQFNCKYFSCPKKRPLPTFTFDLRRKPVRNSNHGLMETAGVWPPHPIHPTANELQIGEPVDLACEQLHLPMTKSNEYVGSFFARCPGCPSGSNTIESLSFNYPQGCERYICNISYPS